MCHRVAELKEHLRRRPEKSRFLCCSNIQLFLHNLLRDGRKKSNLVDEGAKLKMNHRRNRNISDINFAKRHSLHHLVSHQPVICFFFMSAPLSNCSMTHRIFDKNQWRKFPPKRSVHVDEITKYYCQLKYVIAIASLKQSSRIFLRLWLFGQFLTSFLFPDGKQQTAIDHVIGIQLYSVAA